MSTIPSSGLEEFLVEQDASKQALVKRDDMFGGLLELALSKNSAIDVIERLLAVRERELSRLAEIDFNEALNRVQDKIKRVAPDSFNKHTQSRWATYAAIDRVVRPIYGPEGFSLSFTHADCPKPDHIRVIAWLRRKGHKEAYQVDWPVTTAGPKGTEIVTSVQATGISDSYAKRYLAKDIFNIAVGDDDTDGNVTKSNMAPEELEKAKAAIAKAATPDELRLAFTVAYKLARAASDKEAMTEIIHAKDMRKVDLEAS